MGVPHRTKGVSKQCKAPNAQQARSSTCKQCHAWHVPVPAGSGPPTQSPTHHRLHLHTSTTPAWVRRRAPRPECRRENLQLQALCTRAIHTGWFATPSRLAALHCTRARTEKEKKKRARAFASLWRHLYLGCLPRPLWHLLRSGFLDRFLLAPSRAGRGGMCRLDIG